MICSFPWKAGILLPLLVSLVSPLPPSALRKGVNHEAKDSPDMCGDLNLTNLECVSFNLEHVYCQIPKKPSDENNYKLFLYNEVAMWVWEECIEDCEPELCCEWGAPEYDFTTKEVVVRVNVGVQNCREVTFNHSEIVLPDPAERLTVEQTQSYKQLNVSWKTHSYLADFKPGLFYDVSYRPKNVSVFETPEWKSVTGHYTGSRGTVTLESLHGNVEYEVSVRLRSGARPPLNDDWWSSQTTSSNFTTSAVPEAAPTVGVGTFQVEDTELEQNVTLAWRPLPPLLHNGPDLQYQVTLKDDSNTVERTLTTPEIFVEIHNLSKTLNYRMEIKAVNSIGVCQETSEVRLQRDRPRTPVLPVVLFHEKSQFELRWQAEENLTYTVYVCTDGLSGSIMCQDRLYWMDVATTSAINITLKDMNVTESVTQDEVRFALSAENFARESSGMTWDECSPPKPFNGDPPPPEFTLLDATTYSVTVRWDLDCVSLASVVEEVQLFWCEVCSDQDSNRIPKENVSVVFSSEGELKLNGLRENTEYKMFLRLKHRGGHSAWSTPKSFSTQAEPLPTWLIVSIVALAVALTVTVLGFVGYSRGKLTEIFRDAQREINIPAGLSDHQDHDSVGGQGSRIALCKEVISTETRESRKSSYDNVEFIQDFQSLLPLDKMYQQALLEGRELAQDKVRDGNSFDASVTPFFSEDDSKKENTDLDNKLLNRKDRPSHGYVLSRFGNAFEAGLSARLDAGPSADQDAGLSANRNDGPSADWDTGPSADRDAGLSVKLDAALSANRNDGPSADWDAGTGADWDAGLSAKRDAGPSADRDAGPSAKRDAGPSAKRDAGPSADRDAGPSAKRDAGPSADWDAGPSADRNARLSSDRDAGPSAEQDIGRSAYWDAGPRADQNAGLSAKRDAAPNAFSSKSKQRVGYVTVDFGLGTSPQRSSPVPSMDFVSTNEDSPSGRQGGPLSVHFDPQDECVSIPHLNKRAAEAESVEPKKMQRKKQELDTSATQYVKVDIHSKLQSFRNQDCIMRETPRTFEEDEINEENALSYRDGKLDVLAEEEKDKVQSPPGITSPSLKSEELLEKTKGVQHKPSSQGFKSSRTPYVTPQFGQTETDCGRFKKPQRELRPKAKKDSPESAVSLHHLSMKGGEQNKHPKENLVSSTFPGFVRVEYPPHSSPKIIQTDKVGKPSAGKKDNGDLPPGYHRVSDVLHEIRLVVDKGEVN